MTAPDRPAAATKAAGLQPRRLALRLLSLLACLVLWQIASTWRLHLGFIAFRNIPPPSEVAQAAWALLHSPKLASHVLNSVRRDFSDPAQHHSRRRKRRSAPSVLGAQPRRRAAGDAAGSDPPGALPNIVTGLTIGMGTSWFCLVAAEMISGQFGVGYYTWEAYTLQNYPDIVVGMIFIGLLGMASSWGVRLVGARLTPWVRK